MGTGHVEARTETTLVRFDGDILEIFSTEGSKRMPVTELSVQAREPDRKGRVTVSFGALGGTLATFVLDAEHVPSFQSLLSALEAAGATRQA